MTNYVIKLHNKKWGLFKEGFNKEKHRPIYYKVELEGDGTFNTPHEVLEAAEEAYPSDWIDCIIDGSHGYLMRINEWIEECECGGFIDYDGYGDLVNNGGLMGISIAPSRRDKMPEDATHILWYNR